MLPQKTSLKLLPEICYNPQRLENTVLSLLEKLKQDIKNFLGQSYDLNSNISSVHPGLQIRIKSNNLLAAYMQCTDHPLIWSTHTQPVIVN